jgi:hypothetical protein
MGNRESERHVPCVEYKSELEKLFCKIEGIDYKGSY